MPAFAASCCAEGFLHFLLLFLHLDQHMCHGLRQEDLAGTGLGLRFFQYKDRTGFILLFREDPEYILLIERLHDGFAYSLKLFIDKRKILLIQIHFC